MRIALLTTGRHDLACLEAIARHLDNPIWFRVTAMPCADRERAATNAAMAAKMTSLFISEHRPDLLVVVGDRSETAACCVAAVVMRVPIAHIHGGETSLGAIDNRFRHAISQMADIHFTAHAEAAGFLTSMGVNGPVMVSGAPALDSLIASGRQWRRGDHIVCLYHPTTLSHLTPLQEIQEVAHGIGAFMARADGPNVIFCGANPDAGGTVINDYARSLGWDVRTGLDHGAYWDLLASCRMLVGNSSSGIIEAPALGVPVVDIGDRQKGRLHSPSVFHADCGWESVADAMRAADASQPHRSDAYGNGHAGERIAAVLNSMAAP